MPRHVVIAIKLVLLSTILLGVVYPLVLTGLGLLLFPRQANGSLIIRNGRVVGSTLIGQQFTSPGYFHPRPSAAGGGYDAAASGGSNLGPTSRALFQRVRSDIAKLSAGDTGLRPGNIPVDAVTTSGSGLDPDISPAYAYAQAPRIAGNRGMAESRVKDLITKNTTGRQFGILGEPRVNVVRLNEALDTATSGKIQQSRLH